MTVTGDVQTLAPKTRGLPQLGISEIVLKTGRFAEMRAWYEIVFGAEPFFVTEDFQNPGFAGAEGVTKVAFFRLQGAFPFNQIFAIFAQDAIGQRPGSDPGMHHGQLRHASLDELFIRYEALKECGIRPAYSWNHGPGSSFYYEDPDGNLIELSAPNFDNEKDYLAYFATESYRRNITGIEVDPDDYVQRFRSGTPQADLVKIEG
jgi:catechol 2,3-dioxygenase-like lactoylglutathione lyase family enzyme